MRNHRKQKPPSDKPTREAHSTYTAELGLPDRQIAMTRMPYLA